ncbi:MAG: DUF5915 domain-containing protein [Gemmatimonadota bacterium]
MTPELVDLARDELNVKEIRFVESAGELVTLRGKPNYRSLGARFGKRTQEVADLVRAVAGDALQALRRGAPLVVTLDGQPVELADEDVEVVEEAAGELAVESGEGYTVALDPTLDDALRREGLARELVNRIQRFRRDLDLNVSDRIHLGVFGESEIVAAAQEHADYIARETLAVELEAEPDGGADYAAQREVELDGMKAAVALSVVESPDGTVAHA